MYHSLLDFLIYLPSDSRLPLIASGLPFSLIDAVSKNSDCCLETKDHSRRMLIYISLGPSQSYRQRQNVLQPFFCPFGR